MTLLTLAAHLKVLSKIQQNRATHFFDLDYIDSSSSLEATCQKFNKTEPHVSPIVTLVTLAAHLKEFITNLTKPSHPFL